MERAVARSKRKAALKSLFKPGDRVAGYVCHHCKVTVPILDSIVGMAHPFRAVCSKCGYDDNYDKSEIRVLTLEKWT